MESYEMNPIPFDLFLSFVTCVLWHKGIFIGEGERWAITTLRRRTMSSKGRKKGRNAFSRKMAREK